MNSFTKIILFTDTDGRARFREEIIELSEGTTQIQVSRPFPCVTYQVRHSPVGFNFDFHCTDSPIWVIILEGEMEITLRDGTSRLFKPGDCFYAEDTLPLGAPFDQELHGHASRQVGSDPLVTMFVGT